MAKRSVKFAEKRSGEGWKMREEEQEENTDAEDEEVRKRKVVGGVVGQRKGVNGQQPLSCQADDCYADLCEGKKYHRRHKVCEEHAKATIVVVGGIDQRFCQQCSRFHEVSRFDNLKRSCRKRLAGHNERRRKVPSKDDDGSEVTATSPPKYETWRSPNPARHMHIAVRESSFKHFQIR